MFLGVKPAISDYPVMYLMVTSAKPVKSTHNLPISNRQTILFVAAS